MIYFILMCFLPIFFFFFMIPIPSLKTACSFKLYFKHVKGWITGIGLAHIYHHLIQAIIKAVVNYLITCNEFKCTTYFTKTATTICYIKGN